MDRMKQALEDFFVPAFAARVQAAIAEKGITEPDGLRFELSGSLLSVFRWERGKKLVCQIDAKQ